MTPLEIYQSHLAAHRIQSDPFQKEAVILLNDLYTKMSVRFTWFSASPKGIYLWGGVGRGKTFLMDLFFNTLSMKKKIRLHFHRFMQQIHRGLKQHQGQADPLKKIAKAFSKKYRLLCFDEFHVSDIADAMILGELFKEMFKQGIVIVATSNCEPKALYPNGLQRDKFLPAIDLIYQHMDVYHLQGEKDYRADFLSNTSCYHFPLNEQSETALTKMFETLTLDQMISHDPLMINEREIPVIKYAENVVWFDFSILCETARSSEDYIEIAQCFDTVMLSRVPAMSEEHEAGAKRFMHLIDVLYDHQVDLILSAEVPIAQLYSGQLLKETFIRTQSRLEEMQSEAYLKKPHL